MISDKQLHVLRHAIGLDDNGKGSEYRNHYCQSIDFESEDLTAIKQLVQAGLMKVGWTINDGRDQYFHVTDAGRLVAKSGRVP